MKGTLEIGSKLKLWSNQDRLPPPSRNCFRRRQNGYGEQDAGLAQTESKQVLPCRNLSQTL